jgi:hypothetical protein
MASRSAMIVIISITESPRQNSLHHLTATVFLLEKCRDGSAFEALGFWDRIVFEIMPIRK